MADLDLTALRIRLAELEGLDHQALWVHHQPTFGDWVIATQPARAPYLDCAVSAEHAATRDRLARWCAGRVKAWPVTEFPPALPAIWLRFWYDSYDQKTYIHLCFGPGEHPRHYTVPAPDGFEPSDLRTLPDGSRYVEALALVAVARHLGGSRG